MHCRICENKGQSTKCVSEEERKSRDGPPSAYAHVSERSIEQSHAFTHCFSPTAILKIGGKINAAISSQQRSLRSVVEKQTQTSRLPNRCLSRQYDDDMAAHLVINYCLVDKNTHVKHKRLAEVMERAGIPDLERRLIITGESMQQLG